MGWIVMFDGLVSAAESDEDCGWRGRREKGDRQTGQQTNSQQMNRSTDPTEKTDQRVQAQTRNKMQENPEESEEGEGEGEGEGSGGER